MKISLMNINGIKSNLYKAMKMQNLLAGPRAVPELPQANMLCLCEIANKSAEGLDQHDMQTLTDAIAPDGKAWMTKYVAVVVEASRANIDYERPHGRTELTALQQRMG